MSSQDAIQVSTQRVNEIYAGKATSTIQALMLENAQLTGVVEALQNRLAAQGEEMNMLREQLLKATPPQASAPPQDGVDT